MNSVLLAIIVVASGFFLAFMSVGRMRPSSHSAGVAVGVAVTIGVGVWIEPFTRSNGKIADWA